MSFILGRRWKILLAILLVAAGAALIFLGVQGFAGERGASLRPTATNSPSATPEPTPTEPIVPPPPTATIAPSATRPSPTRSPSPSPDPSRTLTNSTAVSMPPVPTFTTNLTPTPSPTEPLAPTDIAPRLPSPTPRSSPSPTVPPSPGLYTLQQRVGVCGVSSSPKDAAAELGFGWYLDWRAAPDRFRSAAVEYMPMIRLKDGEIRPNGDALLAAVDALPGAVWLIGNEPDVKWQDNVTPESYVQVYHDLYLLLKERDPTCQVAIGGISQPTPLRLRYLDRMLDLYQARYGEPMPVDVWNVHNFILREERDSWGVDIPPGMPDRTGQLHEIADHDDLGIFRQQLVEFRRWMAERGQRDKPLIVTEYGILMPAEYGFPLDRVERFMLHSFEYFRTAADPALGCPADGHRLVQRWCWYSEMSDQYPTGNLVQAGTGEPTQLGKAFQAYVSSFP